MTLIARLKNLFRRKSPRISGPVVYRNRKGRRIAGLTINCPPGTDVGILIVNCPGAVIQDNHVTGGRTCIQAEDCPGIAVSGNFVGGYHNTPSEEGHGIQFRHSSGTITRNTIDRAPGPEGAGEGEGEGEGEDGINLHRSRGTVENNTLIGNASPSGVAICIDKGSKSVKVLNNTVINAGQRGIGFYDGADHECRGNRFVRGCGDTAIAVDRECYQVPVPIPVQISLNRMERITGSSVVHVNPDGTEFNRV